MYWSFDVSELTLRNCSRITTDGFNYLATLKYLERIDLYRTAIETGPLVSILKASPRLKHINLGKSRKYCSVQSINKNIYYIGTNRILLKMLICV